MSSWKNGDEAPKSKLWKVGEAALVATGGGLASTASSGLVLLAAVGLGVAGLPVAAVVAGSLAVTMLVPNLVALLPVSLMAAREGYQDKFWNFRPSRRGFNLDPGSDASRDLKGAAKVAAAAGVVGLGGVALIGAAALAPAALGVTGAVGALSLVGAIGSAGVALLLNAAVDLAPGEPVRDQSAPTEFVLKQMGELGIKAGLSKRRETSGGAVADPSVKTGGPVA